MIKFFRKIRHNLLSEGSTGKPAWPAGRYFKYTLGEIVLVVVGILIALQINNWNENRKDINRSRAILGEFKKDLASDTTGINRVVRLLERRTSIETLIRYAQTIEGRNFLKENYSRRSGMIKYFSRVKEEAIQLIRQIDANLKILQIKTN